MSDKTLLLEFCAHLCQEGWLKVNDSALHARWCGLFLASRAPAPPATACALCGLLRGLHDDAAPLRVSHEFVEPAPPATEQRYWRVFEQSVGGGEPQYRAVMCHYGCGNYRNDAWLGEWRSTRELAKADGRASGLPEYRADASKREG